MAARLARTLAADEVTHHGGIKFGPAGTGGRTYTTYSRGGGCACCHWAFLTRLAAILLFTWAVSLIVVSETNLSTAALCAERAASEAVSLFPGHNGVSESGDFEAEEVDANGEEDPRGAALRQSLFRWAHDRGGGRPGGFDGTPEPPLSGEGSSSATVGASPLVHVAAWLPAAVPPLHDPPFDLRLPRDVATAERVVEFCQWRELTHTARTLVGRDNTSPHCRDKDSGGSPSEGSRGGDSCNVYRTDVSFTYVKGWLRHEVPSALFDNPVAYHNPSVAAALAARGIASWPLAADEGRVCLARLPHGACLSCSSAAMAHGLLPAEHLPLAAHAFGGETHAAAAVGEGFTEWDRLHVYRRGQQAATGMGQQAATGMGQQAATGMGQQAATGMGQQAATGMGQQAAHAALSFLVDGVLGFEGPTALGCAAGDVRVSWSVRRLSVQGVSVVGQLALDDPRGPTLEPFVCGIATPSPCEQRTALQRVADTALAAAAGLTGETVPAARMRLLAFPRADLTLDDFVWAVQHAASGDAMWHRLCSLLAATAAFGLMYLTLRPSPEALRGEDM